MTGFALVVLMQGTAHVDSRSGSFYLSEDTCLNKLAALVLLLPVGTRIAMFFEHTEWKWCGALRPASPTKKRAKSQKAKASKRGG